MAALLDLLMGVYVMLLNNLQFKLIKTSKRLTFDIVWQSDKTINTIIDDTSMKFVASNGYEVISRSRMDIQTERIWLRGSAIDDRSGSMVFSSNDKRDDAYLAFIDALVEWDLYHGK